ncbi:cell surface protein [Vandammella animalimorsus]|uniref:Cell surface protein n=1 Tax=Vandammella animalimorsus TaxID=2029117 RepID=A0A3M6R5K5_9BURK|nr:cell surface protein [Vandammella animalimorsus]RMX10662.1 cell surface protein [Vandammella animalimorsus]
MKKLLLCTLVAGAFAPAFAADAACTEYKNHMAETMKKDGSYSEQAMKIIDDQINAVGADQRSAFCKSALESVKNSGADDKDDDKEDDKDDEEKK